MQKLASRLPAVCSCLGARWRWIPCADDRVRAGTGAALACDRTRRRRRAALAAGIGSRTELGYAAIAGLLALAIALWALKIWDASLSVPFRYSEVDDTKFYLLLIKGILAHGWFLTNHNLGAPFGQQLYDYPQGADNLNLFTVKLIGLVSPHPGVVINVFLFVTFVLDGAAACLVLRRLGVSPLVSIVCAVLFALLPYHFFRSDSHLFLSSYWSLPLTAYLFIAVLDDRPLFTRRPSGGRVRRLPDPGERRDRRDVPGDRLDRALLRGLRAGDDRRRAAAQAALRSAGWRRCCRGWPRSRWCWSC